MLKSAEPYEALVKGRDGREVFTQKPCLMMYERKCLRVSRELDRIIVERGVPTTIVLDDGSYGKPDTDGVC